MDLTQKESLGEEDISESQKCCTDCKTTKTPLWRGGPAGPKTLCNACGIRQRKKRAVLGLRKASEKKKEASNGISASSDSTSTTITTTSNTSDAKNGNSLSKSLKLRLMVLGKEVVLLQRQRSPIVRRQRRKEICEEEQAAVMLMSLSCGSVFA